MGVHLTITAHRRTPEGWVEVRGLCDELDMDIEEDESDHNRSFVREEWFRYEQFDFLGAHPYYSPWYGRGIPEDSPASEKHFHADQGYPTYFTMDELKAVEWDKSCDLLFEERGQPMPPDQFMCDDATVTLREYVGPKFMEWIAYLTAMDIDRFCVSWD